MSLRSVLSQRFQAYLYEARSQDLAQGGRAGKSRFTFQRPRPNPTVGKWLPIASHVKCYRQEPRSRRLALTASAGQHFDTLTGGPMTASGASLTLRPNASILNTFR